MNRDAWQDPDFATTWDEAGNLFTNPDRLRQLSLLADMLAASGCNSLVDLGIGSALVEATLHRRHPDFLAGCRVTGIDASAAMLELAHERCQRDGLPGIDLVQADFGALHELSLADTPQAMICVQALHEVPHDTKRDVFAWVRRQLPANGLFYVLDRFAYDGGAWLGVWQANWEWMRSDVDGEVLDFDAYHRQYQAKEDDIAQVEDYRGWLEDAGFETVCPYRCFNRALIVARVPG